MTYDTPDEWTSAQNALFLRLYRHMLSAQNMFAHTRANEVPAEHWQITCWNAAWMAAEFSDPETLTVTHLDSEGNIELTEASLALH